MSFKYVIIEDQMGLEVPILFSTLLSHNQFSNFNVVSAGNVDISKAEKEELSFDGWTYRNVIFTCYGKSVGLSLESRPEEDSRIIQKHYEKS